MQNDIIPFLVCRCKWFVFKVNYYGLIKILVPNKKFKTFIIKYQNNKKLKIKIIMKNTSKK